VKKGHYVLIAVAAVAALVAYRKLILKKPVTIGTFSF
jgi:hypothetical protein